jgi:glycosyltransferase involved in cell wall biosynthesis
MHILISALNRFSKPTGVCRYAANLANCLADTNQISKITLVVGLWQKYYFQTLFKLDNEKVNIVAVDINKNSLARNFWYIYGLPKLAKSLQIDLVHVSVPIPFLRVLFSCPVVATIHDMYAYDIPENFGFPQVIFNQLFFKQCVNNSDAIVCVSEYTLNRLKKYFPNLNKLTTVVYNYVDFTDIKAKMPKNISSNILGTNLLLCIAQHRKNKNLDILIKSYHLLIKNNKINESTKLILVGSDGPETENLLNLISKLSLQERVLLVSSIDDSELCWLYQNCELFLAPSSTEGFCLPLAEALYFSCKVVCTDIPIFREVCSSDCTYFDLEGESINNLSDAIVHALAQPRPNQTSSISRFSKSNAESQYLEFYSKLKRI